MNKEVPYRDQAEKLRQKIEKVNESNIKDSPLPPRSEMHRHKKKKVKLKVKYPLIRLLVLFFILLPIIIFSINSYMGGKIFEVKKASVSTNKEYETINVENSKQSTNR